MKDYVEEPKFKGFYIIFAIAILWLGLQSTNLSNQVVEELPNPPMIELINEERTKVGEKPLQLVKRLNTTAEDKACDMRDRHYFNHIDPDGKMSWHLLIEVGIDYDQAGENIAENFYNSTEVMTAWMKSPQHKANILDADFTEVGYAQCGKYTVQHFAKLK